MSTVLEYTWDSRDLSVWRDRKVEVALARTLSKAGGDAARAMRIISSRLVREKKRMRVSFVNKSLPLTFPSSKEISRLAWRMDVSGAVVPVIAFPGVRQTSKGVSVQINVGQRKIIAHAFIAKMRSGHQGVFLRRGKGRLPIKEAFTTRVVDVFKDADVVPAVWARTQVVFSASFDRLLPLELGKVKVH